MLNYVGMISMYVRCLMSLRDFSDVSPLLQGFSDRGDASLANACIYSFVYIAIHLGYVSSLFSLQTLWNLFTIHAKH